MAINLPQTRLTPGSALRVAGEEKLQRYGSDSKSAIGSALREVVTPPIVDTEPRGSEKLFSVRPEVSQETLPGSGVPQDPGMGAGLPGAQEAQAIIRSAIDSVLGSSKGLETSPTALPGRSILGSLHIGGAPEGTGDTPVQDKYNDTDLGRRLSAMETEGRSPSTSKKFAKLYGRYQKGGTTVTGHKTVEEMQAAGQRQEARRATEKAAVDRMNAMGRERSTLAANVPRLVPSTPQPIPAGGQVAGASNAGVAPSPELQAIQSPAVGGPLQGPNLPTGPNLEAFYKGEEGNVDAFIEQNYAGADPVFKENLKRKMLGL